MSAERVMTVGAAAVALAALAVASTQAAPRARSAAGAPTLRSMIVGFSGTLWPAHTVTAGATTVRVGGRTCAVAAGTPLAVLAADRRAGGPAFSLRDYGRCDGSARTSGQLFVYSLGGQANRGQSGWEYKVDGLSGSTGAADASGPTGNGRLIGSGARVLWFWCQASGGGCQRTLEVSPSTRSVARGAALQVAVNGYENEGRARPVEGAIVTIGSDFASTAANGRATLIAPSARGSYQLSAARRALVPSFPETIVVR
jgi:hypothetical protein